MCFATQLTVASATVLTTEAWLDSALSPGETHKKFESLPRASFKLDKQKCLRAKTAIL
jgi:hypothetical protein